MMEWAALPADVQDRAMRDALSQAVTAAPPARAGQVSEAALSVARDQVAATLVAGMLHPEADPAAVMQVFREVRAALYREG